jgi:transglutaminase-like putative cysteine protease
VELSAEAPVRTVGTRIALTADGPTEYALAIAVAAGHRLTGERLSLTIDGREIPHTELGDAVGGRLQTFTTGAGRVEIDYAATVLGRADPAPVDPIDAVRGIRPSRFAEADALVPLARAEFAGLDPAGLASAIPAWVHDRLEYVPGSTVSTGGALAVVDARRGVCRDFAHLTAGLLRALDVPARVVGVYAPGLVPMDLHAVAEALVDGRWVLLDATRLAPRAAMVRIATGRDTADTAFLTTTGTDIRLTALEVTATATPLPREDPTATVALG